MTMESRVGGVSATTGATAVDVAARERAYAGTSYFGSLDAVRAVSVIAVLWHHTVIPNEDLPISGRGFLGVDMFFALSGFLITTILLREQAASGDISLRRFYARRSLRIFPLYYAIVFGCLALALLSDSPQLTAIEDSAPQMIFYLTNWFPTISLLAVSWSLATEEQFYLVWPPLQKLLGGLALVPMVLFLGANQLVNFGLLFSDSREELEILQVTFTPIILGVLLAYLLHHRYSVAWTLFGHRLVAPGLVVALLVVISLPSSETSMVGAHRLVVHLIMTALLGALVVAEDHLLAPYLRGRLLVRIGAVSYGMYLMHMFVRHVFVEMFDIADAISLPLTLFVAVTVVTYLVAELSFRVFESPLLRLKPGRGNG
ncbi:MAG: acyltransferase [Actinomycetota bacterium]